MAIRTTPTTPTTHTRMVMGITATPMTLIPPTIIHHHLLLHPIRALTNLPLADSLKRQQVKHRGNIGIIAIAPRVTTLT